MIYDSKVIPVMKEVGMELPGQQQINHTLVMKQTRRVPTTADFLNHYESVAGHAQREDVAAVMSRGPPNLHFDLLTGMDERVGFGFLEKL